MQTTTRVRLSDGELTEYLESKEAYYGRIYRRAYRILISSDYKERFKKKGDLRNFLVREFGITSRLSYTIVNEIEGRLKALREHKKYLLNVLKLENIKLDDKIGKLEGRVRRLKEKARKGKADEKLLRELREKKHRLYWLKNRRNKKKQKEAKIRESLGNGKAFRIGFGSKRLFKEQFNLKENGYKNHQEWYEDFIFLRDHNIAALGSAAESSGNQLSTLYYNKENGAFDLRFRKFESQLRGKRRYLWARNIRIPYLEKEIKDIVTGKNRKPLYHRFVRSPKGYYLHISFDLDCPKTKDSGYSGQCGLDYNDGFIELAASDLKGNLIYQKHIELYYHGGGERAKTEMGQKVREIVELCKERNWELFVEDLDFVATKALRPKGKNRWERNLNRITNALDYRRYKELLQRASEKEGLKITFIPPYYTTQNGFKKFGESRKLNKHQAAAYYISRNKFEAA